jgi:hypothetical protein
MLNLLQMQAPMPPADPDLSGTTARVFPAAWLVLLLKRIADAHIAIQDPQTASL